MLIRFLKVGDSIAIDNENSELLNDKIYKGSDYNHFLTVELAYTTLDEDPTMSVVPTLTTKRSDGMLNGPIVYDSGSADSEVVGSQTILSWTFSLTARDVYKKGPIQLTTVFLYKETSSTTLQLKYTGNSVMTVFDSVVSGSNIIVLDESDIDTVVSNIQSSINSLTLNFDNYFTSAQTIRRYAVTDTGTSTTNLMALLDNLVTPGTYIVDWTQDGINYTLEVKVTGEALNELRQTYSYESTYTGDLIIVTNTRVEDIASNEYFTVEFTTTTSGYNSTKQKFYFVNEDSTYDYVNATTNFIAKANENITKGDVLMVTGASGNKILVSKAVYATVKTEPHRVIGFAFSTASANNSLKVIRFGALENINTNTYTAGDEIFLSTTVAGGYTKTKPANGDLPISLGLIMNAHITQGIIGVSISPNQYRTNFPDFTTLTAFNTWLNAQETPNTYICKVVDDTITLNYQVSVAINSLGNIEQSKYSFSSSGFNFQTRTFASGGGGGGSATWSDITITSASTIFYDNGVSGLTASDVQDAIDEIDDNLDTHIADTSNPHGVTASQVGADTSGEVDDKIDDLRDEILTDGILLDSIIPTYIKSGMAYGGTFNATTAVATLSNSAKSKLNTVSATITLTNDNTAITGYGDNEGLIYSVSTAGTFASLDLNIGDRLESIGSAWVKTDNTDSVSSVGGEVGAVAGDSTPTAGSAKFVRSDGIKTALDTKMANRYSYWYNNSATAYWNRMLYFTMPVLNIDYDAVLLVKYNNTSFTSKCGILRISARNNNSSSALYSRSIKWLSKQIDIPLANFVLVENGVTVSLYVKNAIQYDSIVIKILQETNTTGTDYFLGTLENHNSDGSITDLTTVTGTQYASTMMDTSSTGLYLNDILRVKSDDNHTIISSGSTNRYIYLRPKGIGNQDGSIVINGTDMFPELSTGISSLGKTTNPFKDIYFSGKLKNATLEWTMPSASGTLALSSDLGSYLPLSGGTLTGAIDFASSMTNSLLKWDGKEILRYSSNGIILSAYVNSNFLYFRPNGATVSKQGLILNAGAFRTENSDVSLGAPGYLFTDLYLSGGIKNGTNEIIIPNRITTDYRYLFTSFYNDDMTLCLFGSNDLKTTKLIGEGIFTPALGNETLRDPHCARFNGYWYFVYTVIDWGTGSTIGMCRTKDFYNYEELAQLTIGTFTRIWAPEFFLSGNDVYIVINATSAETATDFQSYTVKYNYTNHTTSDLTQLYFYDGGTLLTNVIDTNLLQVGDNLFAVIKNETTKRLGIYKKSGANFVLIKDLYSVIGDNVEGGTIVRLDNGMFRIFYDAYSLSVGRGKYVDTTSLDWYGTFDAVQTVSFENTTYGYSHFSVVDFNKAYADQSLTFKETFDKTVSSNIPSITVDLASVLAGTNEYFDCSGTGTSGNPYVITPKANVNHALNYYNITAVEPSADVYIDVKQSSVNNTKCMVKYIHSALFTTYHINLRVLNCEGAVRPRCINNAGTLTFSVAYIEHTTLFSAVVDINSPEMFTTTVAV